MRRTSRLIVVLGATMLVVSTVYSIPDSAAGPLPQQPTQEQQQQLKRAQEYIDQGEPEYALGVLEEVLEADDALWTAHYLMGMAQGQKGDEKDALASFMAADERQPGVPDVYFMAGIASFGIGDYETCWEQTILAHQAGRDMTKEIAQLREVADPPDDLEERINAPRVLVGPMDTTVTESNGSMESALMGVQKELAIVQRQIARALRDSPNFGLVRALQLADYMVVVNVADYGGAAGAGLQNRVGDVNINLARQDGLRPNAGRNELKGLLELVDTQTNDIAFSLPMTLADITSLGDLTRDVRRRVDLLERWARNNREN